MPSMNVSRGRPQPAYTSPTQAAYNTYGQTARTQANDYSDITNRYRDVYDSIPNIGSGGVSKQFNYNYTVPSYQTSGDYRTAIGTSAQRAAGGTYSEGDKADIRERGISPIRSVYANAQRNVDRQRSLQGGYSPNYAAVSAKMAREMSSQLSDATTRVNAQLAQDVAAQKDAAQSQYLSASANEQNEHNNFNLSSAEMNNRYGLQNVQNSMQDYYMPIQMKLSALSGMNNTFGTQPGFTTTMQHGAEQMANQQAANNQNDVVNQQRLMQIYGAH